VDAEQPWPGEWLRGVLEVCVLSILADGPSYGYAIATRLTESGLGAVKGGTLYPLLARFESSGFVAIEWRAGEGGPGRKYYRLTDDGRAELEQSAERWTQFARLTTSMVASDSTRDSHDVTGHHSEELRLTRETSS